MSAAKDLCVERFALAMIEFPRLSAELERFGMKFTSGGSHISRTMMLEELSGVLARVPVGSAVSDYRTAILEDNVLRKATVSTRDKSLRHLRELYALDEATPIFALLRRCAELTSHELPLLAMQVAWSRDPLLRATTGPVYNAAEGALVETDSLAVSVDEVFPDQYSELNRNKVARNAASSWTQSGHLRGRTNKVRQRVVPSAAAATMALFLGTIAGYDGITVFASPWCRLLDLDVMRARSLAQEAHRAGFLNMRAVGDVVDLGFPLFRDLEAAS